MNIIRLIESDCNHRFVYSHFKNTIKMFQLQVFFGIVTNIAKN